MSVYAYQHKHVNLHIHSSAQTQFHSLQLHPDLEMNIHVCIAILNPCTYIGLYMYLYTSTFIHMYIYTCMYMYIYVNKCRTNPAETSTTPEYRSTFEGPTKTEEDSSNASLQKLRRRQDSQEGRSPKQGMPQKGISLHKKGSQKGPVGRSKDHKHKHCTFWL